jgi:diguanylate cyclase (GGDEF)-like protein
VSWAVAAQRAWQVRTSEEIARAWVTSIVERTSLSDLDGLALGWIGREAPRLISHLLAEVDASEPTGLGTHRAAASRLATLRDPASAPAEVPRDLAVLHGLMADAISRNEAEQDAGELRARLGRLIALFGELHAEFAQGLAAERTGRSGLDPAALVPGEEDLVAELERLVATGGGGARPFSVLELDVDGLRHLNAAEGPEAGDRALRSVALAARRVLGAGGRVFRRRGDELVAIAPAADAQAALELAGRIRAAAPDHAFAVGVASWPAHAGEPAALLTRAREATYAAKASGERVAIAPGPPASVLQRG